MQEERTGRAVARLSCSRSDNDENKNIKGNWINVMEQVNQHVHSCTSRSREMNKLEVRIRYSCGHVQRATCRESSKWVWLERGCQRGCNTMNVRTAMDFMEVCIVQTPISSVVTTAKQVSHTSCRICMEDCSQFDGYQCPGSMAECGYFTCWTCTTQSYAAASKAGAIQGTLNKESELLCCNPSCKMAITLAALLNARAPIAVVEAQQALRVQVVRDKEVQAALVQQKTHLYEEYARIEALKDEDEKAAAKLKLRITEDALTLKCPRCKAAFCDFDGCFSISCHCAAVFCGWCLLDCDTDAHTHVNTCAENPHQGSPHGTFEEFRSHHRGKSVRRCRELIATEGLSARGKDMLRENLERSLQELGITAAEVF